MTPIMDPFSENFVASQIWKTAVHPIWRYYYESKHPSSDYPHINLVQENAANFQ